jgi:RNA polymerase sigma-70 factor (ECF subfamily)
MPVDDETAKAAARQEEAALLDRARDGDFEAFDELVTRHERQVYWAAKQIVGIEQDAEDVVQTTFLKALENLSGFRGEAAFGTWVRRIAVNTALKVLRKRRGLDTVSLEAATREDEDGVIRHPEYIAAWDETPLQALESRELRALLDEAIAALPEKHRLVFVLRDVEGLSVAETAAALELSAANVKVRLLRARLALREALTRRFGDEDRRVHAEHGLETGQTPAEALLREYLAR